VGENPEICAEFAPRSVFAPVFITFTKGCLMNKSVALTQYSTLQLSSLVLLRVLIGWHCLYEGMVKLMDPSWSAAGFLLESKWIFAPIFHFMATTPSILGFVNFMNMWGLTAIGLGLIVGCFTRLATLGGMCIILLYYVCTPPLIGITYSVPMEGAYLIVNKNLIEVVALGVLFLFPTGNIIGLDRLLNGVKLTAAKAAGRKP
jgi:thiosulfate dehydrogenase (quinone) large subunit